MSAGDDGAREALAEFLPGLRSYIPATRQGDSLDNCEACGDIECGGACPSAMLVVRQVIEALDNADDVEWWRQEFRDEGLPLARPPAGQPDTTAYTDGWNAAVAQSRFCCSRSGGCVADIPTEARP